MEKLPYKTEKDVDSTVAVVMKNYRGNPEYDMNHKDFGFKACEKCKKEKAVAHYDFGFYACKSCMKTIGNKPQTIKFEGWKIR